ncbi:hypothetical protein Plhal304r1_c038g0113871 [Plasmopara halstedii]
MLGNVPLKSSAKSLKNFWALLPKLVIQTFCCRWFKLNLVFTIFLLDTNTDEKFHHFRTKTFGYAVLRELSSLSTLNSNRSDYVFQTVKGQQCPEQSQYWLMLRLAKTDLAQQIIALKIYLDPLKLSAVLGRAVSARPHPLR